MNERLSYKVEALRLWMIEQLSVEDKGFILPLRICDPSYWIEQLGLDPADVAEILETVPSKVVWAGVPFSWSVVGVRESPLEALQAILYFRVIACKLTQDLDWNAAESKNIADFLRITNPEPKAGEIVSIDEVFKSIPYAIQKDQWHKAEKREAARRAASPKKEK